MKHSLILSIGIVLSFILPSCTKQSLSDLKETPPSIASQLGNSIGLLSAGDNQYDLLGYGYDVTGRFANSYSAKLQVLDINKFLVENPSNLDVNTNVEQSFDFESGENAQAYSKALAQRYKLNAGFPHFKGEVNLAFNSKDSFYSKYAYAGASLKIKQKRIRLFSSIESLKTNYLSQNFQYAIANFTPAEIVQYFGTHILVNITLGAKLEVNYRTETQNSNRLNAVNAGLNINGAKVLGVTFDLDANIAQQKIEAQTNFNQTLFFRTVGGDGSKGLLGELKLDNSSPTLNIAQWQSSCTRDNAALIEIAEDGLIPIQDLISDPVKSLAVKNYVEAYLLSHQIVLIDQKVPFDDEVFHIINVKSNQGMGASGSTEKGTIIIQWPLNNSSDMKWRFNHLGNDQYKITNLYSGQVLGVKDASTELGKPIVQWPWHGGDEEKWTITKINFGGLEYYRITNVKSGLVLGVKDASTASGARIIQWPWTNVNEEKWIFQKP